MTFLDWKPRIVLKLTVPLVVDQRPSLKFQWSKSGKLQQLWVIYMLTTERMDHVAYSTDYDDIVEEWRDVPTEGDS